MNQNLWGPKMWFFLHTISFNYPLKPSKQDKNNIASFLYSLQPIIPCKTCRTHFKRNLAESPPKLDSRKKLSEWMIDLHNEINGRTGKKILTHSEAINIWETNLGKKINLISDNVGSCQCNYDFKNVLLYILIFLIFVIIVAYYKYKYN